MIYELDRLDDDGGICMIPREIKYSIIGEKKINYKETDQYQLDRASDEGMIER